LSNLLSKTTTTKSLQQWENPGKYMNKNKDPKSNKLKREGVRGRNKTNMFSLVI